MTVIKNVRFTPPIKRQNAVITAAVKRSSTTMIFRLFTLSATIPPTGDISMAGMKAQAVTAPYSAEEPV